VGAKLMADSPAPEDDFSSDAVDVRTCDAVSQTSRYLVTDWLPVGR
jgi:hypothetical protein